MLPDQKIDLWYVPGWIKQTQQQQSQAIKHPGPSNKSPNAVQNTNCLGRVQHLLPLQDRKKAKAISHHCSNSYPHCRRVSLRSQSAERVWQTQEWAQGRACANRQPQDTREGSSFQAGCDTDPPLVYSKAPWPQTSARPIALTHGVHVSFTLWQTNLPRPIFFHIDFFLHLRLCMFGFQG